MAKLRHISGMPVSEGVRLEAGAYTVFAVRNANRDISVRLRREPRGLLRACMRIPFLRGVARLIRDVVRFFDGLSESAELEPQRPVRGTAVERALAKLLRIHPQTLVVLTSAILIPVIAFLGLYAAPKGIEFLLRRYLTLSRAGLNAAVCAMRAFSLLAVVAGVGRLRVCRRLLMYAGAINKAVNCYECRDELSAESAAAYPIVARHSESAFVVGVLFLALVAFPWLPAQVLPLAVLTRIIVLLLIAALLNEPYSALERAKLTLPVRVLRAPMDFLQHMTALEPHPQMLEVAVCAIEAVLGESVEEVKPS